MGRAMGGAYAARGGNQAQGYYTGYGPVYGSEGSGMGQAVNGIGSLAQGNGVNIGTSQWHPTILYLFALIVAEMVVFGFLCKALR